MGTIYACTRCQTVRQFGFSLPDDVNFEPFLNCSKCGKPTRHQFSRLAAMITVKLAYGESRLVFAADVTEGQACISQR